MEKKNNKKTTLSLSLLTSIGGKAKRVELNVQRHVPHFIVEHVSNSVGFAKSSKPVTPFVSNFYQQILCDPAIDGFWKYITKQTGLNMDKVTDQRKVKHILDLIFEAFRKNPQAEHDFDSYIRSELANSESGVTSGTVRKTLSHSGATAHKKSIIYLAKQLTKKINESPAIILRAIESSDDFRDLTLKLAILADVVEKVQINERSKEGKLIPKNKKDSPKRIFCKKLLGIFEKQIGSPHYGLTVKIGNLLFPGDRITEDVIKAL